MNRSSFFRTLKLIVLICGASVCSYDLLPGRAAQQMTAAQAEQLFIEKIGPALAAKCQTCHGEDSAAGLDLRSREAMLKGGQPGSGAIPGAAEKSPVYLALIGRVGFKQMPPGKPLSDDLIATFKFYTTVLHLLGWDHERLTHYQNGADRRLTKARDHA
jgi:hypothetical protein